jgi:hypothetical protein
MENRRANRSLPSAAAPVAKVARSFAIDDFSIGRVVGSGKYGTVYQAKHNDSGKVSCAHRTIVVLFFAPLTAASTACRCA